MQVYVNWRGNTATNRTVKVRVLPPVPKCEYMLIGKTSWFLPFYCGFESYYSHQYQNFDKNYF